MRRFATRGACLVPMILAVTAGLETEIEAGPIDARVPRDAAPLLDPPVQAGLKPSSPRPIRPDQAIAPDRASARAPEPIPWQAADVEPSKPLSASRDDAPRPTEDGARRPTRARTDESGGTARSDSLNQGRGWKAASTGQTVAPSSQSTTGSVGRDGPTAGARSGSDHSERGAARSAGTGSALGAKSFGASTQPAPDGTSSGGPSASDPMVSQASATGGGLGPAGSTDRPALAAQSITPPGQSSGSSNSTGASGTGTSTSASSLTGQATSPNIAASQDRSSISSSSTVPGTTSSGANASAGSDNPTALSGPPTAGVVLGGRGAGGTVTDLGSPIDPNLQTLLRYLPWSSPGNSAPPASPASASTNDGFQGPPMPQISQLVGLSTAPPPIPSSPQMSLVGGDLMARFDSPVTPPQAVSVVNADAAGPIDAPSVSSTPRASIQPAPVPEPSALALLLAVTLGVGARAVYRRRCA